MKKILVALVAFFAIHSVSAFEIPVVKDSTKSQKSTFFIKGRIDAVAFSDSRATIGSVNGALIIAPSAVSYNEAGVDVNDYSQLRFEVATTRIGGGGSVQLSDRNSVDGYVEIDFMSQSASSALVGLRLRHAYARLNLGNSSVLFGQTSHLTMFDEASPNFVTFAGGSPFNSLSRPVQFRFSQKLGETMKVEAALSMFAGMEFNTQAYGMVPDLSARFVMGNPARAAFMVAGGVKFLTPDPLVKGESLAAPYVTATGKYSFGNVLALRGSVMYGSDLSTFGMMGGYSSLASGDGYAAINTCSMWLDIASAKYNGFEFGIFAGYQKNLGADSLLNLNSLSATGSTEGIDSHLAVAPRVWYYYKMVSFGLEYMYASADWMEGISEYYAPLTGVYTTDNNRITLLARFTF